MTVFRVKCTVVTTVIRVQAGSASESESETASASESGLKLGLVSGLELGLEEVFVFDSKGENRDGAVEAVEAVSEARAVRVRVSVSVRIRAKLRMQHSTDHRVVPQL